MGYDHYDDWRTPNIPFWHKVGVILFFVGLAWLDGMLGEGFSIGLWVVITVFFVVIPLVRGKL